jgi:NarL family two-component system sensor histidine kinase LiaS
MLLQKNSQRRSQSSTRTELARDLHDSLAQELVAIGFAFDLLITELPLKYRGRARNIRMQITEATKLVRKELFSLRQNDSDYQSKLENQAGHLALKVNGDLSILSRDAKRVIDELIRNAAIHSKGRKIQLTVHENEIVVSDDGQGLFGVGELVESLGGKMNVLTGANGTKVEIRMQ